MRLIVGLGNPGERYAGTRHNVGCLAVERASVKWSVALRPVGAARRGSGVIGPPGDATAVTVTVAVPLTWMNHCGPAVKALLGELALGPADLIVVHDDLDLPLGRLRIKRRGGAGGHNGVLSIIAAVESDAFCRLKLGVGRPAPGRETADYVLSEFSPDEWPHVDAMLDRAGDALACLVTEGVETAMNRFHKEPRADS